MATRYRELCYAPITPQKLARSAKVLNALIAYARDRRAQLDHPTPRQVSRELQGIVREYFQRHEDTPRNETEVAICQRAIVHAIADAFNLETPREAL